MWDGGDNSERGGKEQRTSEPMMNLNRNGGCNLKFKKEDRKQMQKRKMEDQVGGEVREMVQKMKMIWGDLDHNNNTLLSCIGYLMLNTVTPLYVSTLVLALRPSITFTVDPPYYIINLAGQGISDRNYYQVLLNSTKFMTCT